MNDDQKLQKEFEKCAELVKTFKGIDNKTKLRLYGFYKQYTEGDCKGSRPGIFYPVERAKFDAWTETKKIPKKQAALHYINLVKDLENLQRK